ncbi:MAG: metallophosphoesterase family protein [Chloroflexota bacterium]|nr:metallophosphoesterase family protein [Chloroflexota bacterium]
MIKRNVIALGLGSAMLIAGCLWIDGCAPPPPSAAPTQLPTPAFSDTLVRGPYLQSVTSDSIIVVWETEGFTRGEVVYGETDEYGSSVTDPVVGTNHAVTLANLKPYTTYHYRVEDDGIPLSADAAFRTAAGPDQTNFTFAAFGDTRTQHQIHQEVVDSIVAIEPDFVLHTGDLVYMGNMFSYWETFFEIEKELMARAPIFPALGNHEINHQHYFDLFYLPGNERWYTFDYGNARFFSLQVDGIVDFGPESEQYDWLERELEATTQPWLFVYFHIPPYTSSREEPDIEQDVRQALTPLFEQYGVDVVFAGHHHNYERNEVNGVTYIVTGGGGAPLCVMEEPELTRTAFAVAYHFVLLEVDGNHLEATVLSSQGRILDEFERTLP